jgi:hypothetical protein
MPGGGLSLDMEVDGLDVGACSVGGQCSNTVVSLVTGDSR